jgi:hypothetical protein
LIVLLSKLEHIIFLPTNYSRIWRICSLGVEGVLSPSSTSPTNGLFNKLEVFANIGQLFNLNKKNL